MIVQLGPDHVDVATSFGKLGSVYIKLGDLSQAKDYLDRALAIHLKKLTCNFLQKPGFFMRFMRQFQNCLLNQADSTYSSSSKQ